MATLIDPSFEEARYLLAAIYLAEKDTKKASEQIEQILKLKPEGIRILNLISEHHLLEGNLKEAAHITRLILKKTPDYGPAHIRLGLIYQAAGEPQLVSKSLMAAMETHPDKVSVLNTATNIYLELNKPEQALKLIDQYSSSVDRSQQAFVDHLKGKVLYKKGDENNAIRLFITWRHIHD